MSTREKIENLIVEADKEIQVNNIPSGLQKLEIAKQMATEIGWDERIGMIASLIEDANKKIKNQEEHDKKQKEFEQKKLEEKEKEKQLEEARQRLQDRKKAEKEQKLDALRKKKEIEEKLSSEAYDLLEIGSQALLKDDYQLGKDSFAHALEKFKTINWSAEVNRTQELLNDAESKYKNYQQKLKDDEVKAEKVWEAQKKTRETIELSRKLQEKKLKEQESINLEVQKEENLKKAKSDKALSLLDDAIQFRNLNQFDSATTAYKEALEIFKEIGWGKEAIEVEEEIILTNKQREKLELEKKKLEDDLIKKRQDEEEIEKKAKESHLLKNLKDKEERAKRKNELEILSQKEEKLTEILANISKIEEIVNKYEDQVHLGKILSLECPYPKAILIYGKNSQKLREIGFNEQADRLADGESSYKEKIFEDEKLRVNEKKRLEKIKKDEEELEKKAKVAQGIREEKLRIEKEKRQQELEEISKKDSQLKIVLNNISLIEEVISGYEGRVGLGKILSLECPYPKAVELYYIGTTKLREIGLNEQADRLEEGAKTYKQKIVEDNRLRELEKQRLEKIKLDKEEIEEKARESLRLREEKIKLENEKRQNEIDKHTQKQSQLKEVLANISEMEEIIKDFENQGDSKEEKSPYPEAIELYCISSKKLSEFGFHEQAKLLKDGEISYKQKLLNFEKNQEEKIKQLERSKKQEEEIEKKAEEARKIKELKEKELRNKRQQELEALSKKESKLKNVLEDISEIENVVNEYTREVGLGKILSLECPYPKAVELYNIGTQKLREAGLIEQADRLDEGRKTYDLKIIEDEKLRSREEQRIEKARLDEEEIERKAEEAQRVKDLKDKELREKRQKEFEALSKKESKLKNVLEDISEIENVVNEYTSEVGLGKILSLECPYPKAVELYNIGTQKLREAGLIEQADRLDEGRKTYELKIAEDIRQRELEKQRIEKARQDEEEIEKKAEEARKVKELKEKEQREKRQKELEALSKKESRLKDVLDDISKIEEVVSEYAKEVGLGNILSLNCPYPKAVELYHIGMNKLREAGLADQADRLDEGRKTYEHKIAEDIRHRELENQRIEKTKLEIEEFKKKADESHKIKALKDKELREKRQRELEAISQKESKLKNVLGDISKIEDVVNEYAKGVGLGKILSLECPYPKAVELYNIGMNKLREAGLTEQADRLDEGRKTYERKIIDDKKQRNMEKQRLTKIEVDKEKLELQAQVAAKLKEIKQKEKGEQKKKEQDKLSNQREILTESLSAIDKIEKKVKKYEDQVSLGKILSSKCPYSDAIEVYKAGSENLKQIGLLEQSTRLNEGYLLYKEKVIFDEENRKLEEESIRKDQKSKLDLEQQILSSQKQKEDQKLQREKEKTALDNKYQIEQEKANKAFNLMDEGNKLAAIIKFDDAIEKFQEAMDIFDEIKWLAELDKVLLQISIFRKQKDQKELEKIEEEELKIKKQKEMEDIDKKAKLSWEKKLEEERKKSEIEQTKTDEKRKQWELEFQRKIEEDKKKREREEQLRLEQLNREQEIGLEHQNVYNECLDLLDQAKTLVTEQQFEPAINIYKKVIEKYTEINYFEGIRITDESILKVQKQWDDHKFDIEIAQKSLKEREEEEKRLERLIKESKQKDERKKLLAEQKKLKLQLEKEKETHIQNEIISILEIAGNLTNDNQFEKAFEYYDKTIKLFKEIDWDLKYKQVLSIIQDAKAKKKHFIKLEKQFEEKQKKDQKAQKSFKDFLEKQEAERKSKGEKIKELTEQQKKERDIRIVLEDAAYEYIDQAENCVKGRKFYLSLYYFHYALNNFIEIEWAREAKALKKRFLQVYNLIRNPLIDINEFLNNPKLDTEYHFANSLSLILLAQNRKDFLVAQTELKTVCEMAKNLKWPKSLKLLEDFSGILENEKEEYKKEIEMKKYAPTEGKALQIMKEASENIKNKEFEEGITLANKAKEIYIQMGIEREARKVEQELLRWKLKYSRHQLNQQREKSKAVGPEKKTFLSEDERKNLIIEERKRRRREARKKLLGD